MASTGEQAVQKVAELKPDILLLDLQMPGGTGWMSCASCARTAAERDQPHYRRDRRWFADRGQDAQGAGHGAQEFDPAYLLECLERVSRGGRWIDPELSDRRLNSPSAPRARGPFALSRERELISLVRKGMRNREIAEQLGVTEGTTVSLFAPLREAGRQQPHRASDPGGRVPRRELPQELTEIVP